MTLAKIARGLVHHVDAEVDDQSGLLGDGEEILRHQPALARMIPAHQRLETGDGTVLEPDDRLVHHLDFIALDRLAQVALQRQPVVAVGAHRRDEDLDAVAALPLGVGHGELGILQRVVLAGDGRWIEQREPDRGRQHDLALGEGDRRRDGPAHQLRQRQDALGVALRDQDHREGVAADSGQRILRPQQPAEPARQRQQDRIPGREADRFIDLLEAVDIDHEHGRADVVVGAGETEDRAEPVLEQLAIGQAGQVVVHGIVQHAFLGGTLVGDVGERADDADDLAIGADDRPGLDVEPVIGAIGGAQAHIEVELAAPLFEHRIERDAVAVPVRDVHMLQPARGRALQRPLRQAEQGLDLRRDEDLVGAHVPVEHEVARAGEGERAPFCIGDEPLRDRAAGEGMLDHGEADQQHDQHESAQQGGRDQIPLELTRHGEAGGRDPDGEQEPGRDQHHRPLIAMRRQMHDEHEADGRHGRDRDARDAGRHRCVEDGEADQPGEAEDPDRGDVAIAHMPALQVEIGEEEDQQRRRQHHFRAGPVDPLDRRREREQPLEEAEIEAGIGQNRPG